MIEVVCLADDCDFGIAFEQRDRALAAFDTHRLTTGHSILFSKRGVQTRCRESVNVRR